MFEKTLELWDKPKILWTLQDKFDLLCETWWIIILAIIIILIIVIITSIVINKIFDWIDKHDML